VPSKAPALGRRSAMFAVATLALAFAALMCVGLALPSLELYLDMNLLYENQPTLKALSSIIDSQGLPALLHTDVGIWEAIQHLGAGACQGEINSIIAFLMYSVFVVLFPVLDMLVLLLVACMAQRQHSAAHGKARQRLLAVSRVLRKVGMLDVSLVGVILITLSLKQMRSNGVILSVRSGAFILIGAEACHYLAACLVAHAFAPLASESDSMGKAASVKGGDDSENSTDIGSTSSGDTKEDSEGEVRELEADVRVEA